MGRFSFTVFLVALLGGCGPYPVVESQQHRRDLEQEVARLQSELEASKAPRPVADARVAEVVKNKPISDAPSKPVRKPKPESLAASQKCWQDYCPCDPIIAPMDKMLCRDLRAGIAVELDHMRMGANLRDIHILAEQNKRANQPTDSEAGQE